MGPFSSAVRNWKPGDRVTVHCNYVDDQDPSAHNDSMLATNQLIWGFETNFGGLADLAVVTKIDLEIQVPPSFPEKYLPSLVRSAELCAVKKHMENPPVFEVTTKVA